MIGSPGWVRCQCIHWLRFVLVETGQQVELDRLRALRRRDEWLTLVIPYVDATYVAAQVNRYCRQQRVYLNRNLVNHSNTFMTPSEQADKNQQQQQGRRSGHCVSLGTRMKLDRTLVRNVMREVTNSDPDGDRFLGRVFMGPVQVTATVTVACP